MICGQESVEDVMGDFLRYADTGGGWVDTWKSFPT